ncbi:uncharacterized protein LOC128736684 [Sabethes cyaneus]|uniref:uncharacterized protein LOC128736684 n=1 Tax=Sabethes cyaneus TaxID=53552 RepID=UPI00237D8F2B|nr:uncharacterized protein LOC128736684 [Sabethes cyaneus]
MLYTLLILFLIALLLCDYRMKQGEAYRAACQYPGGAMLPLLGNLLEVLVRDPVKAFEYARSSAMKYGQTYRHWIFGDVILNITRAKETELILSSTKHTSKSIVYRFLAPLMGDGLLCSKGDKWKTRRRILSPAFHFNILNDFLLVFQEEANKLVNALEADADRKREVVLQSIITRFTLNTICETAMGVKLDSYKDADRYRSKVYDVGELIVHRTMTPWLHGDGMYNFLGYLQPLERAIEPIHEFTRSIIGQKREIMIKKPSSAKIFVIFRYFGTKQRYAMLNTLLIAEANNEIDETGIREEVDTFMFEGHDTTAAGIIFALLLLANEQDAQEKVYEEFRSVQSTKTKHEVFTTMDYNNLKYLDRFIKESLRLYPPVAFISRSVSDKLKIDSTTFPHGTMTNIHIFDLHRDPAQFPDPEKFDPDRFLTEVAAKRNPYAYVPFSAGPRNCIGQKYALLEMKTIICALLDRYRILPITTREEVIFMADLVLRAKSPIKVLFVKRDTIKESITESKTFDLARTWPKIYGGSYRFWLNEWLFALNIVRVRELEPLLSSTKNIDKSMLYHFLHPFLGLGLLTSTGPKWLQRRRILTPTFHFNILTGFHKVFLEECEQLLQTLEKQASCGEPTKLQSEMSRFTLSTICETSMGVKLNSVEGGEVYRQKLYEIGELLVYRLMRPWIHSDFTAQLSGYFSAFKKLTDPVHSFTKKIIKQRREQFYQMSDKLEDISEDNIYTNTKKRYAMLDSLLLAEKKGQIAEEGIREEVDTFTFEGHDTTAAALVFIFFQLALEPAVQEQMYQEICEVRSRKPAEDKWFSQQDYMEMKFVDRAVKECLRMWPPVAFISRGITEDIVLADGDVIPAGCIANVHIFDLHRDPEQFPNPDVFDADRFLPENVERRNPYAYVPFSAGPRNCIGQKYAMMELKVVVAHTLLQFKVLPKTRLEEINFVADLVLRSTNPIEVRFVKR